MLAHPRRKKLKHGETGYTQDRISNLPDVVLTYMLSFLSTREAVKTSILSSRWKSIWASVPTLELSEWDFYLSEALGIDENKNIKARDEFVSFVHKVLLDQRIPSLEKVAIRGRSFHNSSHIKSWICAAVRRNVRKLELTIDSLKPVHELPQTLFFCTTLVVVKFRFHLILNFPTMSICFPNLKVLELREITYKDDSSLENLISGCPVLEELVIVRNVVDNLRTLNITSRVLKNLRVSFRLGAREDHINKMVIDAPALKAIDIEDDATQDYMVRDLSSIVEAKLHLLNHCSAFKDSGNYEMHLLELFRRVCDVKFLSLSSRTMLGLSHTKYDNLPEFHNLNCLELCIRNGVSYGSWKLVMDILNRSPVLEVLVFQGLGFRWRETVWTSRRNVPNCVLSHLKTIKIMGLVWAKDLRNIRYFLEDAKVLEKIIINIGMWREDFKLKVREELAKLPKGSTTCEIEIC